MNSHSHVDCFGVHLDTIDLTSIFSRISQHRTVLPYWIVTANPEIVLHAKKHPSYKSVLSQADIRTIDGVGLQLYARLKGARSPRIIGVDLADALVTWAHQRNESIAILGGRNPQTCKRAAQHLLTQHPGLRVFAAYGGSVTDEGVGDKENDAVIKELIHEQPSVLFVGFGHPKQECWIHRHRHLFTHTHIVVGVGGTIDFWGNAIRRAPRWIRSCGLEWLFRLIQEPRRWKRIFRAVIVFPLHCLVDALSSHSTKS